MTPGSEEDFQKEVLNMAYALGWQSWHFRDSRRQIRDRATGEVRFVGDDGAKGFPDLVMAGRGQVLFRELKSDTGTVELAQLGTLFALEDNGGNVDVWRPRDWTLIERTLIAKVKGHGALEEERAVRIAALRKSFDARIRRAALRQARGG